jgi:hypothetical protein
MDDLLVKPIPPILWASMDGFIVDPLQEERRASVTLISEITCNTIERPMKKIKVNDT